MIDDAADLMGQIVLDRASSAQLDVGSDLTVGARDAQDLHILEVLTDRAGRATDALSSLFDGGCEIALA